jgi:hypothetical protein
MRPFITFTSRLFGCRPYSPKSVVNAETKSLSVPVTLIPIVTLPNGDIDSRKSSKGVCASIRDRMICSPKFAASISRAYDHTTTFLLGCSFKVSTKKVRSDFVRNRGAISFAILFIVVFCSISRSFCMTVDMWCKVNSPAMPPTTTIGPIECNKALLNDALSYHRMRYRRIIDGRYSIMSPTMTDAVAISANHSRVSKETSNTSYGEVEAAQRTVRHAEIRFILTMLAIGGAVGFCLLYVFFAWIVGW